MKLWCRIQRRE